MGISSALTLTIRPSLFMGKPLTVANAFLSKSTRQYKREETEMLTLHGYRQAGINLKNLLVSTIMLDRGHLLFIR